MRILIVSPSPPHLPIWGFNIRVHNFVKCLAKRHEISVLSYFEPGEDDGAISALESMCATVRMVPRPDDRGPGLRRRQLHSLMSTRSFQGRRLWSHEMQRAIDETLSDRRFDIVQVESSRLAAFGFDRHFGPIVLDEHNLEYELLERMSRSDSFVLRKAYTWTEAVKFRHEEQASWRRFDGCVLTSDREQDVVVRNSPGLATAVVPNGVDIDYFRPTGQPVDPDSIVFTGLMTYRPNADGATYFIREVLPLIRKSRPNARFTCVGWGLPPDLARMLGDGVIHTGRVPDVRPYVASAAVVVVPLRMGSGTRLKVLEGLAMGKGLVSTTLGCEGVSVVPAHHLLVADDPRSFANAVLELMGDSSRRERLGSAGRALAEREYGWAAVVQGLEAFHQELLTPTARVGPRVAVAR